MSLFEPTIRKNACQIHKSCHATASSMNVGLLWSHWQNWPFRATAQFFHSQCLQSMEPIYNNWSTSLLFGLLRYSSPNTSFTPLTNLFKHSADVLSPIRTYSSIILAGDPYANIQIAAMHFYNGERSILLVASILIWKYSSCCPRTVTIRRNTCLCNQNLCWNWAFVYTGFLEK